MALLYSSVGHGGGSGYLATLALFGIAPAIMKPTALVLNILVAGIATIQFSRVGLFSWRAFWPFAVASIPMAFVGGSILLPTDIYKQLVGVVLMFAAYRLWLSNRGKAQTIETRLPPIYLAILIGGSIGLLSGLTGVGGGIFLSPLLLLMRWTEVRQTSALSAAFVLVNSIAGLTGNLSSLHNLPWQVSFWAIAAILGGLIGSELGRRRLATVTLRRLLSVVLVIAGLKLIFI